MRGQRDMALVEVLRPQAFKAHCWLPIAPAQGMAHRTWRAARVDFSKRASIGHLRGLGASRGASEGVPNSRGGGTLEKGLEW